MSWNVVLADFGNFCLSPPLIFRFLFEILSSIAFIPTLRLKLHLCSLIEKCLHADFQSKNAFMRTFRVKKCLHADFQKNAFMRAFRVMPSCGLSEKLLHADFC